MTDLVIHLDTAGAWKWRAPDGDRDQPGCVRISMLSADDDGNELAATAIVIDEPDVVFEPGAVMAHGIDAEVAARVGRPLIEGVTALAGGISGASAVLAYGHDFHCRVAESVAARTYVRLRWPDRAHCVMRAAIPLVRVPRMRPGGGFAFPKLRVAAEFVGCPVPPPGPDPIADGIALVRSVHAIWRAATR